MTPDEYRSQVAASMPERVFQAQVIQLARLHCWGVYHTHDSRRSQAGFPDLVLVRGSQMLCMELKTMRGRLSEAQCTWITALEQVQTIQAGVWRPKDWDTIVATLEPTV